LFTTGKLKFSYDRSIHSLHDPEHRLVYFNPNRTLPW